MPQTYPGSQRPSTAPRQKSGPTPLFLGSGQSSKFLSPFQEARINSWRSGASNPPPSGPKSIKVKSAPASINIASSKASSCTCTCNCTQCGSHGECQTCGGGVTSCSCSLQSPKSKSSQKSKRSSNGPNTHVKGYYSSHRKQANPRPEPPLPVSPKSPINFAVLKAPDRLDLPTPEQVRSHQVGVLPPIQWPPAPGQEIPMREMAKPAKEPPVPRIAGARDPVTQNYWRQMFPPHAPLPIMGPGLPPAIGMIPARPWGP
ncbi:uncharacterized protein IL334_006564 [Kwoniella shivajii]|uniref:Uncharacterized protein n=1 Tax=Kwoniella shivajii TaxID=564305 RepID=A0ABZ1D878_9TREE|nr:hypothetical protein IL334_006564 [Kwoniella shivajii]